MLAFRPLWPHQYGKEAAYAYFYRQALSTVAACFAFRLYNIHNAFNLTLRCFHSCTRILNIYKDFEPIIFLRP